MKNSKQAVPQAQTFIKYQATFQTLENNMKVFQLLFVKIVLLTTITCEIVVQPPAIASAVPVASMLQYLNEARTNPVSFAEYVRKEISQFINQNSLPLTAGITYKTNEGISAWKEAENFLLTQKPLPALQLNDGLNLAAQDHAIDMVVNNFFGHNSYNGQSFVDRITYRCGQSTGSMGENLGAEFKVQGRNHALQTVLGLIIDDGVANRGHRKNIFSQSFRYVGINARVQGSKIITVFDFHSSNLPTKNPLPNTNTIGLSIVYDTPGSSNGSSAGGAAGPTSAKTVVSTSTRSKTSTVNGVTTIVKTVTTTYSDGTKSVVTTTTTAPK